MKKILVLLTLILLNNNIFSMQDDKVKNNFFREKINEIISKQEDINQLIKYQKEKQIYFYHTYPLVHLTKEKTVDLELIKKILAYGANPNLTNGYTPLFNAIDSNNIELTKILLSYGADPNITSGLFKQDALMQMVDKIYNFNAIKLIPKNPLMQQSYDNAQNKLLSDYIYLLKILLYHGANPELKNSKDQTAIDYANKNNLPEIEVLLKNSKQNLIKKLTKLLSQGSLNLNNKEIKLPKDIAQLIAKFRYN